jgi:signal peptidase
MTLRRVAAVLVAVLLAAAGVTAAVFAHQGYRVYVVRTGSMLPTMRPGDAVLDRPASAAARYGVGDIITFPSRTGADALITHRIHAIDPDGTIHTKGDANRTRDEWKVDPATVRGSVVRPLPWLGFAMVYLHHAPGVASVMTLALLIVLAWGLFFPPVPADEPATVPARARAVLATASGAGS